jgi:hypothetical protein
MSQRNVEILLGKLLTDEDFRRSFFPPRTSAEKAPNFEAAESRCLDLTPVERSALSGLRRHRFELMAESLDPRILVVTRSTAARRASWARIGAAHEDSVRGKRNDDLGGLAVMKKRMILMLVTVGAFLVALGDIKYRQVQAAIAQYSSFQPPPEAVTTVIARRQEWPANLAAIGTVAAARGVTVSADLPGIVARIAFESGKTARQATSRRPESARAAQLEVAQAQQKLPP